MGKWVLYIKFIFLLCALTGAFSAAAQPEGVFRTGRLENGLTYYLRHTDLQPGTASFYLVQNVGSLMEEENQNGLAHFLEHMAFNATRTFPRQVDMFLQSRNITSYNAYTAHNETVYNLDNVPVKQQGIMDSCLLILRDWCHYLSLTEEGIAKERGIIEEEWRRGRDAMARALDSTNKYLYNNSKYAAHNVIGNIEIIRHFKRDELAAYYNDWYRPELQAVIVVGDFNLQQAEDFIRREFSPIPKTVDGKRRDLYKIPENQEPLYCKVADKGLDAVSIDLVQRIEKPALPENKEEQVKRMIVKQFYNQMIAARLNKPDNSGEVNAYQAAVSYDELTRGYDCYTITVNPYPQKDYRALSEVLQVIETVKRFGFTAYEFDLQKKQLLRQINGFERNMDKMYNQVFVSLYRYHFLEGVMITEPEERNRLSRVCLERMTVGDVNDWMHGWLGQDKNRVFIVTANEEDYPCLSLEDILDAEADVRDMDLEAVTFKTDTVNLIDFPLIPGKIVKERVLPVGKAKEWTLNNGAKIVFMTADEGSGNVEIVARSSGGMSLVQPQDLPSAMALNVLALRSGVYKFDQNRIGKIMQAGNQEMQVGLRELNESVQGRTSTAEVRQFFELMHLAFTRPRFDEIEYTRYINELKLSIDSKRTPLEELSDSVSRLFMASSPRLWKFDTNYIQAIDRRKIESIYNERFGDASDFVFYIVGDLEETVARELVCSYIGSLPSLHRKEKYVGHDLNRRFGYIEKVYKVEMQEDKAMIELRFRNRMSLSRQEAVTFWMFGVILKSRCMQEIREKRGATYNVDVATVYSALPFSSEDLSVSFETDRLKAKELKEWVRREIDGMAAGSVTVEDIRSIAEAQKRSLAAQPRGIRFWKDALFSYCETGVDKTKPGFHDKTLDAITPDTMGKLMRKFLKHAEFADIVFESAVPENNK